MGILAESEWHKTSVLTDQRYILVIAKTYIISVIIVIAILFGTISRYFHNKYLIMWSWMNYLNYLVPHLT